MLHPVPHQYQREEIIVELKGMTCGYDGTPVLRDVNLKVLRGEFVGLLGPSGSGKTTLLRAILGAVSLYEGDVLVEGQSVVERKPRVGYVPQLETIDWDFPVTVEQVVMMGRYVHLGVLKKPRSIDHDMVDQAMETLKITDLSKQHVGELSGGQQRTSQ